MLRLSDILVGCHKSTYDLFCLETVSFSRWIFPKTICRTFWCLSIFSSLCHAGPLVNPACMRECACVCMCGYNLWLKAEISADMMSRGERLRKGEVKEERKGGWRESKVR